MITIVSGLPRSGTSMMMAALKAGGMPLLVDGLRQTDQNNPKGYFEFEPVKKLPNGQTGWLISARGKAVKVISALLKFLPQDYAYQIIFMERDLNEILTSQRRMLERSAKQAAKPISDEEMEEFFQEHLAEVKSWLAQQDWIQTLYISYNQVLCQPLEVFKRVDDFLTVSLDIDAMASVVDPSLYREKNRKI